MKIKSGDTFAALMRQEQLNNARLGRRAGCSASFISQLRASRIAEVLTVPTGTVFVPSTSSEAGQVVHYGTTR
jgi:hypothetical protein